MDETLAQRLVKLADEKGGKEAIRLLFSRIPDTSINYATLFKKAQVYARLFQAAGVRPGEVVILVLEHGEHLVFAFWGALLAGVVPAIMPFLTEKLSPEHYRRSLGALFEITAPAGVVTFPEFLPEVEAARRGSSVRVVLSSGQVSWTDELIKAPPKLHQSGAQQSGNPETADKHAFAGLHCASTEIALLQHSSGTTGLQKGVALSHRAIFNQVNSYARALRLDTQDGVVSWLPLYHDMGLIAGFLLPILSGIPLTLMSPFDWVRAPARLLQAASQQRATLTWLPNFAYNFLAQKVRLPELEGMDLSCLRSVINCSEPVNWKSHQMFLERYQPYGLRPAALATCYAMAENVFAVTQAGIDQPVNIDRIDAARLAQAQVAMPSNDPQALPMLSCGKPVDGTRLRVLGADGELLPERSIGEIAIQSDCMLTGYFNRPDLTRQAFLDGWYLTGDLGYLADGELYVTGRKKDLIIVGGKNIYPQDLERLAGEVPGVYPGRVAAFGIFNERLGTEEAALVAETELEGELQRQRIGDEIRQAVTRGSDIALRLVLVVERNWLLKTSSGKISRAANREKFLSLINGGEE